MKKSETKNLREHWFTLVEEQKKSGLSQKSFCEKNGLNLSKFVYYRCLCKKQTSPCLPKTAFVPVKLANTDSVVANEIKLSLPNGFHCTFPSSMDMVQLKRMIGVLLTC